MEQKNIIIAILTIIVVILAVTTTFLLVRCDTQAQAINAVDNYIESTADTGEMDEFIQSHQGQIYIEHTK